MEKEQLLTFLHNAYDYFAPYKQVMEAYASLMNQIRKGKMKRNRATLANMLSFASGVVLFAIGYFCLYLRIDTKHISAFQVILLIAWVGFFIGIPVTVKKKLTKRYQQAIDQKLKALMEQSTPYYNEILEAYLEYQAPFDFSLPFSFCYPDYIAELIRCLESDQAKTFKEAMAILQNKMVNVPNSIFHYLVINVQQATQRQTEVQEKENKTPQLLNSR
jgi:hypothetical protein